ncbi:hypothetical protein [Bacillus wiedmannii]|uniref:Uncharacterized protein n=1 Tax=Bacillus wiedmannii TaxID=1890302 RepID=A0A242Z2U1_9BACI|nr:hypothetical protein [Bacillus wiedmannii]MED3122955.1 hypothetical protein [Bacillus wiedmannii]OTX86379.1 hypothetical protein BK730_21085 [Bacillus wiedmannii]
MSHRKYSNYPELIGEIEKVTYDTHKVSLHYFNSLKSEGSNYTVEVVVKDNGKSKTYNKKFSFTEFGYREASTEFLNQNHEPNIEGYIECTKG